MKPQKLEFSEMYEDSSDVAYAVNFYDKGYFGNKQEGFFQITSGDDICDFPLNKIDFILEALSKIKKEI